MRTVVPAARHRIVLDATIRSCRESDLAALEWYGMFTPHRELIRDAFDRQERGDVVMLVADLGGFPAAQVWIDLVKRAGSGAGLLWAARVFPLLRGHGLGGAVLRAAEDVLGERGFEWAEIGVEKHNPRARQLYERLGYELADDVLEWYEYTTPDGHHRRVPVDQWMLRKRLGAVAGAEQIARRARAGGRR